MKIGIISAMQEEIQALHSFLKKETITLKGKREYYDGLLFGQPVVLVFSRWGKVASATTTTQLINDFNVDEIIFTGVAGSVHDDLNIGDIVIGKHLYQHDMDASPLLEKFEIPLLRKKYFETQRQGDTKALRILCVLGVLVVKIICPGGSTDCYCGGGDGEIK